MYFVVSYIQVIMKYVREIEDEKRILVIYGFNKFIEWSKLE